MSSVRSLQCQSMSIQELGLEITHQHADSLFKDSEYLQIWVRGPIEQDGYRMEYNKRCKV
ncbi:hypothetical protein ColTof4_07327 [Colletotrichum tofieldiae]|nr:hypothetical protein ColTof3_12268 [Colletotrichum tofieldiae]GKT74904.1 hypothetical protein ColTof4_07327 [Colletotrichum tofieldiae]GKT92109.1 hypothetical protein Ct61P_09959 [Colletotrichum tofieldiae]